MQEFMDAGIKDHPAISSEYVKFLAANTGFEKVNSLEKRVTELDKTWKEQCKTYTTANNKVVEVQKVVSDLVKRLTKIESKK